MTKLPSKISIKKLLTISFLLPVLIIVILGSINIYQNNKKTNSKINNAKALKQYYDLLPLAHQVIQHLQSEREYSFLYLESEGVKNLNVTQKNTDAHLNKFIDAVKNNNTFPQNDRTQLLLRLEKIALLRKDVIQQQLIPQEAFKGYTQCIEKVINFMEGIRSFAPSITSNKRIDATIRLLTLVNLKNTSNVSLNQFINTSSQTNRHHLQNTLIKDLSLYNHAYHDFRRFSTQKSAQKISKIERLQSFKLLQNLLSNTSIDHQEIDKKITLHKKIEEGVNHLFTSHAHSLQNHFDLELKAYQVDKRNYTLIVTFAILATIAIAVISMMFLRNLVKSIRALVTNIVTISSGNLDHKIISFGPKELQLALINLEKMRTSIASIIHDSINYTKSLKGNSTTLKTASKEIAQHLNTQKNELEIITTDTNTLISHAKENASNSSESLESIVTASVKISNALNASQQATDALNVITQKSNVIKTIASETNLLAINSSIEAKRVGKWGKGFSVIAHEIRNLSERSTFHSKEIDKHSSESNEASQHALQEMISLLPIIDHTKDKTKNIHRAYKTQKTSIESINTTILNYRGIMEKTQHVANSLNQEAIELDNIAIGLLNKLSYFDTTNQA